MTVDQMTRKQLEAVPYIGEWDKDIECCSIVILPATISLVDMWLYKVQNWIATRVKFVRWRGIGDIPGMHDSGYRCMGFILVDKKGVVMGRTGGWSDVVHIEGIGGYGKKNGGVPSCGPIGAWSIDCLPMSGLLRLWPTRTHRMVCGEPYSSFEIYSIPKEG